MIPAHLLVWAFAAALFAAGDPLEEIDRQYRIHNSDRSALEAQTQLLETRLQAGPSEALAWRLARSRFALGNLSTGDTKIEQFGLCIQAAGKVLELNPRSAIGYFFRGLCRGKQGEARGIWGSLGIIKSFREDMHAALKIDPAVEAGGPHRALGKYYMELPGLLGGSMEKSIAHLEEAVRLGPEMGDNYLFLAEAYFENQQFVSARNTVQTLLERTPADSDHPEGQILRERGQELLKKITPWIGPESSNAQRDPH